MAGSSFPTSDAIRRMAYRRGDGSGESQCAGLGRVSGGITSRERWYVRVCPKLLALAVRQA